MILTLNFISSDFFCVMMFNVEYDIAASARRQWQRVCVNQQNHNKKKRILLNLLLFEWKWCTYNRIDCFFFHFNNDSEVFFLFKMPSWLPSISIDATEILYFIQFQLNEFTVFKQLSYPKRNFAENIQINDRFWLELDS